MVQACKGRFSDSLQLQSGDSSELAARLPCKGKRGEKPWCLPDNALPSDTPQLAAGRLHSGDSSELAARLPCKGKRGEKPWCLPDNALPSDTPQLAAGRLHSRHPK